MNKEEIAAIVNDVGQSDPRIVTFSTDTIFDGTQSIECPVCHECYVHIYADPLKLKGNDGYEASPIVRGDVLAIPMWCEQGHTFILCLGSHKGEVHMWCIKGPDWVGTPPGIDEGEGI